VVRYNTDGSLDTTFNTTGIVTTPIGSDDDTGQAIAIQPDGKIVVVGYSGYSDISYDFAVVRYNTDGSLDTNFNTTGKVTTDFDSNRDKGRSVALQSDGKIVVAGEVVLSYPKDYQHYGVARYNTGGSLDTTFNTTGKVTFDFSGNSCYAGAVALQSDGKILVAGTSNPGGWDQEFGIARLNSSGSLDTSFSSDGQVTTGFGGNFEYAYGNIIQTDGKYVVVGTTDASGYDFAVARYLTGSTTVSGQAGVGTGGTAIIGSTNVMAKFNTGYACTSGVVTVTKALNYPGGSSNPGEMPMYWNISNDCGASAYSMDLSLCYTDGELANGNSVTEANLKLYRWSGSAWVQQVGTVDTALNCVTMSGVTSLSSWTLGDPTTGGPTGGPTAVTLSSFSASAEAETQQTLWVLGALGLVAGLGGGALMWTRRARQKHGS